MLSLVLLFFTTIAVEATNPIVDGSRGAEIMKHVGASDAYVSKMKTSFERLRKAYCDPVTLEDRKIIAVSKCDTTHNFDIAVKCIDDQWKGKSLNEKRKMECRGGPVMEEIDHRIDDCIRMRVTAAKFKIPEPVPTDQLQKMSREQFVKTITGLTDRIQTCLERAVA